MNTYVSVKAFGDLVIALTALGQVAPEGRSKLRLIIGRHLAPLASALASPLAVDVLRSAEGDVPSVYNVRRDGVWQAIASALALKRALHEATGPADRVIFDRSGSREWWLGVGRPVSVLPARPNIYQAYSASLEGAGLMTLTAPPPISFKGRGIGLFPSSRHAHKNLTVDVIRQLIDRTSHQGCTPIVYVLEDERPDIEDSQLPVQVVKRDFNALLAVIRNCQGIISADSLPAHLEEYAERPVFVMKPQPNCFWLPLSAYTQDYWALFDGTTVTQENALDRFLTQF